MYTYDAIGLCSGDGDSEEDDQDMDVDAAKQADEAARALEVADALGRTSDNTKSQSRFDDLTNGLRELDMEHYDEEDEGIPSASVTEFPFFLPPSPFLLSKFKFYWE